MAQQTINNSESGASVRGKLNAMFGELYFAETDIAYVDASGDDATGVIGVKSTPFQTINAALDAGASVTNLKIKIGLGTYASPSTAKIRANLWIEGSGKPGYNWSVSQTSFATFSTTDPTALKGGTILQGSFTAIDKSNIHLYNLGVDCGSAYVSGGGTEDNCIAFGSSTTSAPFPMITNIEIRNVTVLGRTASSAFHGIIVENVWKPIIDNADTYFATHGIAIKAAGGIINNVRCQKHTLDGIIVRGNTYAFSFGTQVTNFEIQDGGGLIVDASGSMGQTTISDGHITFTTFGVKVYGQSSNISDSTHIHNVRSVASSGIGFDISSASFANLSDCINRGSTGIGFKVVGASGSVGYILNGCYSIGATSGFDVTAPSSSVFVKNCHAVSSSGFGFVLGTNVFTSGLDGSSNTSGLISGTAANTILNGATVSAVSPTSPNRTIAVSIAGTTYYVAAKTTND